MYIDVQHKYNTSSTHSRAAACALQCAARVRRRPVGDFPLSACGVANATAFGCAYAPLHP